MVRDQYCQHCAALFLVEPSVGFTPKVEQRNGTVTFIEFNQRIYGLTCRHVVEALRRINGNASNDLTWVFATITQRTVFLADRFQFPEARDPFDDRKPDLAIRKIHPKLCENIGKRPFKLTPSATMKEITYACAVGYPEELKGTRETEDSAGYRIRMTCVQAVAEIGYFGDEKFSLHGELDAIPDAVRLSGMSGGPIFRSDHETYDLLGIIYEAMPTIPNSLDASNESLGGGPRIFMKGWRVTYDDFASWVEELGLDKTKFADEPLKINANLKLHEDS